MSSTILVVDDSEDDQRLYQRAFKDFDYILEIASTAQAGLARLADAGSHSQRPDLILLDYNLPDMDGLSLMKKLAEYSGTPIPIVMLTGEGNTAVAVEVIKNGADDYLVKDTEGRYLRLLPGVIGRVLAAHEQRVQTLRLQQESETLLRRNRTLMQNSMDGIHVMDMDGNIVEANDAFCRMLGYSCEETARLNVADWDAQWSAEELRERFKELIGKSARFETVHRRKDGSLIDVEICSSGIEIEKRYFLFAASRDITERKRAEEELKLRAQILNSISDSVFLFDLDGKFVYLNEAAWKSRGYTRDEMMAMSLRELNTPKYRELVAPRIKEILESGQGLFESEHLCKNGSVMAIEISSRIAESGGRKLVLAVIRDITERKKAEAVLKLNKNIIENAYDGFWMYDTNGYLLNVNQAYADMIGYTREELIGKHISQLSLQSNTPELVKARVEKAVVDGPGHFETQHRHKDGHIVDFDASIAYIPEAQCLFSFLRDVTERKKNEAMLMQHKVVIDTSIDGFWVSDMRGNVLEANEAYAKMSGYTVEELARMHISQLEAIELKPEDVQAHIAKTVELGYDRFETRHRHKDGHEIDIEVSVTHMKEPQRLFVFCRDITERKRAEAALQRGEANLRAMLDNSPYLTWLKDAKGRYISVNKVFADYLRLTDASQAIGKTDLDLQPKELAEKYRADDAEVMAARRQKHVEESAFDGKTIHWVETFKTPIIDTHGNVLGTVGFASDITERKRSEQILRESEVRLKNLFENLNSGVAVYSASPDGRDFFFTSFNRAAERIENIRREDLIGKNVVEVFPGIIEFGLLEVFRRVWESGVEEHFPITLYQDGRIAGWRENYVYKLPNGEVVAIYDDVTERKQAEEELLLASKAEHNRAELLAQQFGHLLQNSFNEIYLFGANTLRFLQVSEGAKNNLGYSFSELEKLTPVDLKPSFTKKSFEQLIAPLRSGEQQSMLFETFHRRKDGTSYPVEVRLQLMETDPPVFVAIVQDITERHRAESQLRGFAAHLQTVREEEKANFAREIHDDLGSTLTALKMDASWLAQKLPAQAKMLPLRECAKSMVELIDNAVMATRRIITDLRPSILDTFGLEEALKWQAGQFHKRTGIECRFVCVCGANGNSEGKLDKTISINLFRIFQEALTNVARHSGASRVEAELRFDDNEVVLSISDNGRGLPKEHAIAATSFGLRSMSERVEQLNGQIGFDGTPGGGFSVTVRLPLPAAAQ